MEALQRLYREWPFFETLLDNAELSCPQRPDRRRRVRRARRTGDATPSWARIGDEHRLTVELLLRVTGRTQLLEGMTAMQRSISLRERRTQTRCPSSRSALDGCGPSPGDPEWDRLLRLVHLTVNGVAAALQGTG